MKEPTSRSALITVSIVSHGHGEQVECLVDQVLNNPLTKKLVLTLNTAETLKLPRHKKLVLIENHEPRGFGANHNAAFEHCDTPFYCVLNPDVELRADSLSELLTCLEDNRAAIAGPLVLSPAGKREDSWRKFPTLTSLLFKALGHDTTIIKQAEGEFQTFPDWIAGMCMLFNSDMYKAVGGFDERLFLYYEDVDVCARLWRLHKTVVATTRAVVIHDARRASRRQLKHMKWHIVSMAKYLVRYSFNKPRTK